MNASTTELARALQHRIEAAYRARGDQLGWRFLYSPVDVLAGAPVAFIGLNPGGRAVREDHAQLAMPSGSAYEHESWRGCAPGEAPLQRQVRALCARLGVAPDRVLAGNLVPFRSPDWASLKDPKGALSFGCELWRDILARSRPALIVTMGGTVTQAIARVINVLEMQRLPVGWGAVHAKVGAFAGGKLVGLPHLSRFPIFGRANSEAALAALFDC